MVHAFTFAYPGLQKVDFLNHLVFECLQLDMDELLDCSLFILLSDCLPQAHLVRTLHVLLGELSQLSCRRQLVDLEVLS